MKLPKHKLPKQVHKKFKTAKHKDSERHQEKRQKIIEKKNNEGMTIDEKSVDTRYNTTFFADIHLLTRVFTYLIVQL